MIAHRWLFMPLFVLLILAVSVGCSRTPERKINPDEAKQQLKKLQDDLQKEQQEPSSPD